MVGTSNKSDPGMAIDGIFMDIGGIFHGNRRIECEYHGNSWDINGDIMI